MRSVSKRGFTLIELLVVIAIIAILASILFPVFAKAREKARQTTCLSQIRQLATAMQMYNQDNNGRFPGRTWDSAISPLLGDSQKMFFCPSDAASDTEQPNSYGYGGLLVRADGSGVNEAQIKSPTEVGVVCDASPSKTFGSGGVVGGGALQSEETIGCTPNARHSNGVIVGYADGHAKYFPKAFNEKDMSNGVTRAFFQASALGLIDNPVGTVGATTMTVTTGSSVAIGGEYCTMPIITAAAEVWKAKGGTYFTRGFLGQNYSSKPTANFAWGNTTGAGSAIAKDCVVAIVAKASKIPSIGSLYNSTYYAASTATIAGWFSRTNGYVANSVQAYTFDSNSSTRSFFLASCVVGSMGSQAVTVANDAEMVDKVANDPYGIGYCSSAFADPERVVILAYGTAAETTTTVYPNNNPKYRWIFPATQADCQWPWKRTLYAEGAGTGTTLVTAMTTTGAANLKDVLEASALFKCSYWKP